MAVLYQSRVVAHWACHHVLEELSERARCSGATCLLSVDIVHGRIPAGSLLVPCHRCTTDSSHIHMPNAKL